MRIDVAPAWDDLRVLLAVHRHRSLLGAGKALGVSTSTAARRIEALEASLGRPLVHRNSGGTSIEPGALELVALAEQMELGLLAVKRDGRAEAVSGTVRVSMADVLLRPVTALLCDLRRRHPALSLELVSETRFVDLSRREADIGIRGKSASPALVQRAVGRSRFGLYASDAYVERRLRGGRLSVVDFARHDFLGFEGSLAKLPQTAWLVERGAQRFVVRSNSEVALLEATAQGQGICMIGDAMARSVPGLLRLEVDAELPSASMYLAYHRDLRGVPRVRVVLDALFTALRDELR
jgi:DNA-binding transcriptional LysR family regulator